jgi:hypothetical protein
MIDRTRAVAFADRRRVPPRFRRDRLERHAIQKQSLGTQSPFVSPGKNQRHHMSARQGTDRRGKGVGKKKAPLPGPRVQYCSHPRKDARDYFFFFGAAFFFAAAFLVAFFID